MGIEFREYFAVNSAGFQKRSPMRKNHLRRVGIGSNVSELDWGGRATVSSLRVFASIDDGPHSSVVKTMLEFKVEG